MTETLYPIRRNLLAYLRANGRAGAAAILAVERVRRASALVDAGGARLQFTFPDVAEGTSADFDTLADSDRAAVILDAPPRSLPYFVGPELPPAVDADLAADLAAWKAARKGGGGEPV